jgi:hypothetical protein
MERTRVYLGLVSITFGVFACAAPPPALGPAETAVLEVTDAFFEALSAGDTATLGALVAPGAVLHSVRMVDTGASVGVRTREEFLEGIGADDADLLERVWGPTVLVKERVAVVWTPYDFHLNGEFTHCGIDVLTLLESEQGWRITGVTYNVVTAGCAPSPLGSPSLN